MFGDFNQFPPPLADTLSDAATVFVSRDFSIERIAKNKKLPIEKKLEILKNIKMKPKENSTYNLTFKEDIH